MSLGEKKGEKRIKERLSLLRKRGKKKKKEQRKEEKERKKEKKKRCSGWTGRKERLNNPTHKPLFIFVFSNKAFLTRPSPEQPNPQAQ